MSSSKPAVGESDRAWRAWRERIDHGEDPALFIQEFPDDLLVVLLQSAGEEHATTRNLVLAETLRRVSGRPSDRSTLAAEVLDRIAHEAEETANTTAQAVHETEAAVEAKSQSPNRQGGREAPDVAHAASDQIEKLREIAHTVERKADFLMRLHRTGEFVTPGRPGEQSEEGRG